ncbi:hypothetical protein POTOM_021934 [Populus tomentosa]|uniref:Fungal lipase-type domain-containing protein n=1 Tax=Populus tomentosa TaxID=118781 RepID=A0A8X8CSY2_POPTO|nr:hypothetical protein POTOM_021934 [Populus tomentosa]
MANRYLKRLFHDMYCSNNILRRQQTCRKFLYGVINRSQSEMSKSEKSAQVSSPSSSKTNNKSGGELSNYSSGDDDLSDNKGKIELAWLTKALEPALQLCRWALSTGNGVGNKIPASTRSVSEIIASIQRSKIPIEGWSLSDLTIGLYLIYLRQASLNLFEDVKGVEVSSESIVHDLIYHVELAKGCYKDGPSGLVRNSMIRENNILKFVKNSSVMRPGYYIAIDPRKKLVILGIRGTHTVYDLITDIVSSSDGEVTFEGYSTHFGTTEAARWFLSHEMGTIRKCLEKYEGFRLRLVGHSLGAATASLLAIMLRKKSPKELGFSPHTVTAVGYASPPCVSKELAESCSDFVINVVMKDDIIPRLSAASLERLRNEILQTDWMSVVEKEDWKSVIGLVTNAKQVVTSIQDVAQKLADYAKFGSNKNSPDGSITRESLAIPAAPSTSKATTENAVISEKERNAYALQEELFVPGSVYYLKRDINTDAHTISGRGMELFTLWKRHPGEHFQRIVLPGNIISDHKCDSHYYALRDVLKGLPGTNNESIFK